MMDRGRFDDLVDRIETRYEGRPEALAGHAWRWLIVGYGVVIALTVLLVGGGLAVFTAGVLMPDMGILLVILGGCLTTFGIGQVGALLFVEHQSPQGRRLDDDEAPELYRLLELLRSSIGCPELDEVILTDDFNAAIVQHPRLGIFGWPKSWLIMGVPLLLAASPQEIASVLAHEYGHISRKHGRQGNRIYRMHQSWEKLFVKLQQNQSSGFVRFAGSLLSKFLNWYWPRFHARAFVLSRQNEYLADQLAVEATSSEYAASALWRIDCTAQMLENEFWKSVWDSAATDPEPPDNLCDQMKAAFRSAPASPKAERWCDSALQRVTNNQDTHPALSDRLTAMGVSPEDFRTTGFPPAPSPSAAEALLTTDLKTIENWVNEHWRTSILAIWHDRHRRITAIRKLAERTQEATGETSDDPAELWSQTRKILDVQGLEAAEPSLRKLLALKSDHVGATFALGQLRLNQGHQDGEDLLQHVLSLQTVEWTTLAGQCLEHHLLATGQQDALKLVRQQLDDFEKTRDAAERERTSIRRGDRFTDHGLDDIQTKQLQTTLLKQQHCRQAWLVQKQLLHFPEEKLFVLCVDSGRQAGSSRTERNDRMISSLMISLELPGRPFIVNPTGEFRSVAGRLMKRDDWKVFERSDITPLNPQPHSDYSTSD